MKLRRAVAAAAATAVIIPAALLAAPTAHAGENTGEQSTTRSTDPSGTPDGTEDDDTTPTDAGADKSAGEGEGEKKADADAPGEEQKSPDGENGEPGENNDGAAPPDETQPGDQEDAPPADQETPGDEEEPGAEEGEEGDGEGPLWCSEIDKKHKQTAIKSSLKDLPGQITAGSGWHRFTVRVANVSDKDVKGVDFYAEVENFELYDESKWLSPYLRFQYRSEGGTWEDFKELNDMDFAGGYYGGVKVFPANTYIDTEMRINIAANAPAGDSYALAAGDYFTEINGQKCLTAGESSYDFVVLKPGSEPDDGDAEPGDRDKDKKRGNVPAPQGELEQLPVSGTLAETGASSALPMVALAGATAVALGAGAMFVVRRRRGSADTDTTAAA